MATFYDLSLVNAMFDSPLKIYLALGCALSVNRHVKILSMVGGYVQIASLNSAYEEPFQEKLLMDNSCHWHGLCFSFKHVKCL
jgi:hypothetical protein